MTHLDDFQLQALADGTLRGPEGLTAREHCEECLECGAELSLYSALAGKLSALRDPPAPEDFTKAVLAAVEVREAHLSQRRHTLYAALPAAALALFAIVGWGLSAMVDVPGFVDGFTALRTVVSVAAPVVAALRLPLGIGALVLLAVVLAALSRALRPSYRTAAGS